MTYNREELEHAYNATRRLRARLAALARVSARPYADEGFAAFVAGEAVEALEGATCIVTTAVGSEFETLAVVCRPEGADGGKGLERAATRLAEEVSARGETLAIADLPGHGLPAAWLAGGQLRSYLGVPLRGPSGEPLGVAGVFGSNTRHFNQEDEWWLVAATLPVAALLAVRKIEARVRMLEGSSGPDGGRIECGESFNEEPRPLNILVVDDDRTINDLLCEFLSMEGHRADPAFDGMEALRTFRPGVHDAVITDVAMPLMNGWELISSLHARAPGLPVVLITGYGNGNWNESFLQKHGVCALLNKPLNLDRLTEVLQRLAERQPIAG